MGKVCSLLFFLLINANLLFSQTYSLVIKEGHVIDPKNGIDAVMDVAINDGKIVQVAKNIDASQAVQVVNAKGLYVTPGIIDIHTHNFVGTNLDQAYMNGPGGVVPDGFTLRCGVTTVVDAGSSGWRTFPEFKKNIIDRSQTRVLAFLNIVGQGMRGGPYEQDTSDMDAKLTAIVAKSNKKDVVGIKLAHYEGFEWVPADRAVEAGKAADIPVMIDFGGSKPPLSIEDLFFKHLRPGDIFTHCFAQLATRGVYCRHDYKKSKAFCF
jgi:dihydroorotase